MPSNQRYEAFCALAEQRWARYLTDGKTLTLPELKADLLRKCPPPAPVPMTTPINRVFLQPTPCLSLHPTRANRYARPKPVL